MPSGVQKTLDVVHFAAGGPHSRYKVCPSRPAAICRRCLRMRVTSELIRRHVGAKPATSRVGKSENIFRRIYSSIGERVSQVTSGCFTSFGSAKIPCEVVSVPFVAMMFYRVFQTICKLWHIGIDENMSINATGQREDGRHSRERHRRARERASLARRARTSDSKLGKRRLLF